MKLIKIISFYHLRQKLTYGFPTHHQRTLFYMQE